VQQQQQQHSGGYGSTAPVSSAPVDSSNISGPYAAQWAAYYAAQAQQTSQSYGAPAAQPSQQQYGSYGAPAQSYGGREDDNRRY